MMDRRKFILGTGVAVLSIATTEVKIAGAESFAVGPVKNRDPKKALVFWYSQTKHTARMGRLAAKVLEGQGLAVDTGDIRTLKPESVQGYDLLLAGSPVNFFDVPINVRDWMNRLPDLTGVPVGSWVTYGNNGHNPKNAARHLLSLMAQKGAVPVGTEGFSNMNTYMPFIAMGSTGRTLKYKHLPDEKTFEKGRAFARQVLENARAGKSVEFDDLFTPLTLVTKVDAAWWSKKVIDKHAINPDTCIQCGTCESGCPVGAITVATRVINRDRCIGCLGCLNNCPTGAMEMELLGRPVPSFPAFCKENHIVEKDPPELTEKT